MDPKQTMYWRAEFEKIEMCENVQHLNKKKKSLREFPQAFFR